MLGEHMYTLEHGWETLLKSELVAALTDTMEHSKIRKQFYTRDDVSAMLFQRMQSTGALLNIFKTIPVLNRLKFY